MVSKYIFLQMENGVFYPSPLSGLNMLHDKGGVPPVKIPGLFYCWTNLPPDLTL
jgi:hypothetical protein